MTIQIVAACSLNNVIGKGVEIPWRVKGEQKIFKQVTMGGTLVMGRITYDSIGKPLPGRSTIIITRDTEYVQPGCQVAHSFVSAIDQAKKLGKPIYVVGGGEIYKQALPKADIVHLTTIETEVEGDIFFPHFPIDEFNLVEEKHYSTNMDYVYRQYKRKTPS